MKPILLILILTFLLTVSSNGQQKINNVGNEEYVSVNNVLPVIVSQPNCPIKIENFMAVKDSKGRIHTLYQIKNIGKKEIKEYSIARWYSDNSGFVGAGVMPEKVKVLKTNESASTIPNYLLTTSQIPEEIKTAEINETKNELQKIVFVMVVDIWFTDGSKFSEMKRFNALEKHLELFENEYDKFERSNK